MKHLLVAFFLVVVSVVASAKPIDPAVLSTKIAARVDRVPEFKWIHEEARKDGLRVWLFGGTAAAFAHYVAWDLEREAGNRAHLESRFDYDYTNIFRSTQDLDIVVDGSPQQVDDFREKLRARYPYLEGSRQVWEVRALRHAAGRPGGYGYKEALLDDPDMRNQHTDSNSVGMVEVTAETTEPRVRDLRDWNADEKGRPARFLKDVATRKIHYYFSKKHETTARARVGQNPPILSVIRALTKAYQFGLTFPEPDMKKIRQIVAEFDPAEVDPRAVSKIEQAGMKLIQHAVDIETAVVQMDELGLRTKLSKVSRTSDEDSLKIWMEKEPLRTHRLGLPGPDGKLGMTAKERGITVVSHETKTFVAYESITRASTGVPNVLISRKDRTGETAYHGDGFYTKIGREGARGTNLTIRFELDPKAREGSDFRLVGDYVIILNKAAIRVIPESLNFTLEGYFEFLRKSSIEASDKALLEKLNRRLERYKAELTPEKIKAVEAIVAQAARELDTSKSTSIFSEWLNFSERSEYPELVKALSETSKGRRFLIQWGLDIPAIRKTLDGNDFLMIRKSLEDEIVNAFAEKSTHQMGAKLARVWIDRMPVGSSIIYKITEWEESELWQLENSLNVDKGEILRKQVSAVERLFKTSSEQARRLAESIVWRLTSYENISDAAILSHVRTLNRIFAGTNMAFVEANTNMSEHQAGDMLKIARVLLEHRANALLVFEKILLQARTYGDPTWVQTVGQAADLMTDGERKFANDTIRQRNIRDARNYLIDINHYRNATKQVAYSSGNGIGITIDIGQMLPDHIQEHIRRGGSVEISVGIGGQQCYTSKLFR